MGSDNEVTSGVSHEQREIQLHARVLVRRPPQSCLRLHCTCAVRILAMWGIQGWHVALRLSTTKGKSFHYLPSAFSRLFSHFSHSLSKFSSSQCCRCEISFDVILSDIVVQVVLFCVSFIRPVFASTHFRNPIKREKRPHTSQ